MRIAVDAMGGDDAPRSVVHGAVTAAREDGLALTLVGAKTVLEDELSRFPEVDGLSIRILDASDAVGMDESALAARVPCITTIAAASAAVHAIANARAEVALSLQERIDVEDQARAS